MKKIITLILSLNIFFVFSQIGIIGEFTGWGNEPDIPMTHLGGGIWTASNVAIDIPGGVKFRINNDWTTNWGWDGNGLGFPSGLSITGLSQSIPSEFGTFNVTFNSNTLEYSFIPVYTNQIGFHGGFNNFLYLVPMYSIDGINFCKKNFYLKNPNIKFRDLNNPFLELGGNTFPSGFANTNNNAIPSLPGFYDISFNINTWEYSFTPIQIGLIGSSIPPYNWIDDAVMYSPDWGITNYVTNFTTINGSAKFRTLGSWSTNFGNGSDFPTGTATNGGPVIPVIAGTYDTISFNRKTGQYCFGCLINSPLPQCNSVFTDTIIFIGSICDSFYVSNNNQYYTSSGIYIEKLFKINGCDSIIKLLDLTFNNTQPQIEVLAGNSTNYCTGLNCSLYVQPITGATYQWKQNNFNIPGANNFIFSTTSNSSANGNYYVLITLPNCLKNSNIISISTFTNTYQIYDTICGGPYSWNGVSYNTSGNYNQTFQAQNGCDSVVTLHLIVHPNNFNPTFSSTQQLFTSTPFAVQFSNSTPTPSNYIFTWYWGDGTSTTSNNATVFHEYLSNGLYTVTLEATSTQTGCSDETTLTDYIYTTGGVSCAHSATINQTGPISACSSQSVILSCNSSPSYNYQWRRNGVYISGNNNDSLIVSQPGAYSVIISDNGCPVSSSQVTVNFSTIATPVISSNGSIQPCVGGSVTLSAASGYTSYLWSNGATTQSTSIASSGSYTVQVTNSSGCSITSNPFIVNASILPTQNICVVGVDSVTNNIRVVWEKPITNAIDSFYVYRETSVSNVYAQVGARPYDSLSVWLDPIANPSVQAYRYKITALDTCGSETPLSNFHKTIHLTINQGVGNAWNLIWSNYEGLSFGSYNIYRGTSPSNLSLLTTIQSNLNSYTDLSAPTGNVYYQIEIVNPNNCNPTKSMNYSSSKSNIVNTNSSSIDEINESNIVVYPNPANDLLSIESESLLNSKFRIIDAIGRTVYQGLLSSNKNSLNISDLSKGTYTLMIENHRKPVRFIKQ